MKVPPKRKGNAWFNTIGRSDLALNESPSEKEGKSLNKFRDASLHLATLNESPSEKEGK